MEMNYVLSAETADKVKHLIGSRDGQNQAGATSPGAGTRQIAHVNITGTRQTLSGGMEVWPCTPQAFSTDADDWITYAASWCVEANSNDLQVGDNYIAIRYGTLSDGTFLFITDNTWPMIRCGLAYEEDPTDNDYLKLNVDLDAIAGLGLTVTDEISSDYDSPDTSCPTLQVDIGCHMEFDDDDAVDVDVQTLVGPGLTTQLPDSSDEEESEDDPDCEVLAVRTGCGLTIDDDYAVAVDLEAIAGDGLTGDNSGCLLSIDYGCGLTTGEDDELIVNPSDIAGWGLEPQDPTSENPCEALQVKAGCGIAVNEHGVRVHPSEIVGCGLKVDDPSDSESCVIDVDNTQLAGCGLTPTYDSICKLDVDNTQLVGCGLKVASGSGCKIQVDNTQLVGCGLKAGSGCTIQVDTSRASTITINAVGDITSNGCGIIYDLQTWTLNLNSCGVVIGVSTGALNSYSLDLSACCSCSESESASVSESASASESESESERESESEFTSEELIYYCAECPTGYYCLSIYDALEPGCSPVPWGGLYATYGECAMNCGLPESESSLSSLSPECVWYCLESETAALDCGEEPVAECVCVSPDVDMGTATPYASEIDCLANCNLSNAYNPGSPGHIDMVERVETTNTSNNKPTQIDAHYLLNLKRRPDRLAKALAECSKAGFSPEVVEGLDGHAVPLPKDWKAGAGAYGCLEGHKRILAKAIQEGKTCIAVYEDDVVFTDDYLVKLNKLLADLPDDWDAVFVGGQHLQPPTATDHPGIVRCAKCHRNHGYILRGDYIKTLYQIWASNTGHADHIWNRYQKDANVYAVEPWLAAQGENKSDINGKQEPERWWHRGKKKIKPQPKQAKKPCGCKGKGKPAMPYVKPTGTLRQQHERMRQATRKALMR